MRLVRAGSTSATARVWAVLVAALVLSVTTSHARACVDGNPNAACEIPAALSAEASKKLGGPAAKV